MLLPCDAACGGVEDGEDKDAGSCKSRSIMNTFVYVVCIKLLKDAYCSGLQEYYNNYYY